MVKKQKQKSETLKIVEGGLISAALGIAAGIVLAPEAGKKFSDDLRKKSAEFHAYLAPRFENLKRVSQEGYDSFVKTGAETYAKAKHISATEKKDLVSHAKKSWKHIKKHSK